MDLRQYRACSTAISGDPSITNTGGHVRMEHARLDRILLMESRSRDPSQRQLQYLDDPDPAWPRE